MNHIKYLVTGFVILMGAQLLPTNQPTSSLTPAQKLAQLKQTKQAQLKQAKQAQSSATKIAPKTAQPKSTSPNSTSPNSSENDKLIQDFLTAAKKLPEYKKPQPTHQGAKPSHQPSAGAASNQESPKVSSSAKATADMKSHEKEVEKVFEAYKKMQPHVKEISLTKSQEKEIRKAANNLFEYKMGQRHPIKNMAWKGYKAVPDSNKTATAQPTAK